MMTTNPFDEQKEREEKSRRKFYALKRETMLRKRLGLTRKNQQVRIGGLAMFLTASPSIVRERWFKVPRGRKYHFAVLRYQLRSEDGRMWTALQAQAHDANYGYMLNVTGFWGLKPA